ncbi:MAG: coenzyme F420-0:L-glutamate ligase [Asgard group archaeon]|nr:coenzyme F420-0:L-glutamate ligase [Asgard group archaeon]
MLKVIPIQNIPIIKENDNIGEIIINNLQKNNQQIQNNDIFVIAQSIISRAEGRIINLEDIEPSKFAKDLAENSNKDPRHVEIILREAKNVLKNRNGVLVTETKHGFVCANSGVDKSNVPGTNVVSLLPIDPDKSAKEIREVIEKHSKKRVGVIISDTHNRPFRLGAINIAIGCSGIDPIKNYSGEKDLFDYELKTTSISIADQLCSAAGLIMGEGNEGFPVIIIRGYEFKRKEVSAKKLIRPEERDYFR